MKRVLVTGGTGFIGQYTLAPLIERDFEVHIVSSRKPNFFLKDVTFHLLNLLDCDKHLQLMYHIRPTHLLHAAWYTENGKFWDAIENVYWLKATISLAEAFYAAGGVRLLGLGTCAEYDWSDGLCAEGKTSENPASLYGKVKKSAYECLNALAQQHKMNSAWARIFFPYGSGESKNRLIPSVITNLLQGSEARCTHGNQIRDFLHVCDVASALVAILDSEITRVVNVGSGTPVTIREIVSQIALKLKNEHLVMFGAIPEPAYSPQKILADINRLKNEVGWSASLSLDEGLQQTIAWWQKQNINEFNKGNLIK